MFFKLEITHDHSLFLAVDISLFIDIQLVS